MATTYPPAHARQDRHEQRERRPARLRSASGRLWRTSPLTYITLVAALLLSVFPLYVMIVGATESNDAIFKMPPSLVPGGRLTHNLQAVFSNVDANVAKGLLNSIIISSSVTVSVVFFSSLAGFAFAKLHFRGKNALLLVILGSMMIPVQIGLIPLFLMMVKLGWENHLAAVIVPALVNGFGVFLMRQYASQAVPDELIEAARIDGSNTWGIYWHVVLPALRPAAAVLGIFTFMQTWNDFLWPLVALQDPENPTVLLSLRNLGNGYYQDYAQVFAGTAVATVPLLIVFILLGRQIIGGIMEGALKA
ncbi:carbohydrate ABC transporter permease [Rugosimonospora africana]|uniref:Sugar ABC transporter permease n=1 Tax=Rugosimonospora africana TaxID=556532 RepID=A0A8J3QMT7_9ACTN|nr:carbohydrate ABC transporter permease [Rugosimonospora africana]GIH13844.1 sugar ABC transporter permease [Rugosimonospora africana]